MAKLIISSSRDRFEKMAHSIDPVFDVSSFESGEFGAVQTYSKLNVPTVNCYHCGDGFAMGVGTFICNGKRDKSALEAVFHRYDGSVRDIQQQLMGSYVILVAKDNELVIFIDGGGLYNFYYQIGDDDLIAANSLFHLGAGLDDVPLNEDAVVQAIFQYAILNDETIIEGVRRLRGDQALVFEGNSWEVRNLPSISWAIPYDEAFWPSISRRFEHFGYAFERPGVGMTGGQDSRTALALLLSAGVRPQLVYWRGNSTTTNTKQVDEDIVNAIAARCNLVVKKWNAYDGGREGFRADLRKYGEYALAYGYNENLFRELRSTQCDFLTFGYFGELLRNIEEIGAYQKEKFSIEEYFDDLYLRGSYGNAYGNYARYRLAQIEFLKEFCLGCGLDPENLTKNDFQIIHTETYRKRADVFLENFANLFVYSTTVLGDKVITDTISKLPFDVKQESRPMLEALSALAVELLEIPFYSHSRKMVYDQERFCLRDAHGVQQSLKQYVQQSKKSAWYYSLARNLYHILNGDRKSLREAQRDGAERQALMLQARRAIVLPSLDISQCPEIALDNRIMMKVINYDEMYDEMKRFARKEN